MQCLKIIVVMVLTISLVGCVTPPGKLSDADLTTRKIVLDMPVSKAVNQLLEGLRYCGPSSGGVVFVTHHGVPKCMPIQEDGSTLCDLYVEGSYGQVVLGIIELRPISSGTEAIMKVRTYAANKDNILKSWEFFLRGRAKDVCP